MFQQKSCNAQSETEKSESEPEHTTVIGFGHHWDAGSYHKMF